MRSIELMEERKLMDMRLESTKGIIELWGLLLLKKLPTQDAEFLIKDSAEEEWGESTHCEFDPQNVSVTIENFDGRKTRIHYNGEECVEFGAE